MTNKAPQQLTRLLDDVHVGHAPLNDLLTLGRAARRRRRRARVAGAVALALIVVGGTFALARTLAAIEGDTLVADGATGVGELSATVEVGTGTLARSGLADGEAAWNTTDGTLLYASHRGFSSSCPPEATLSDSDGSLSLQLANTTDVNRVCTADVVPVVVTISGLGTPPEQVTVTEEGDPPETVAVASKATSSDVNLPCPIDQRTAVDIDVPGPGQPTPEAAVALLLPQLGQLSVGSVKSGDVGPPLPLSAALETLCASTL